MNILRLIKFRVMNELDSEGSAGGFDMDAAADSIGADLFPAEDRNDDEPLDTNPEYTGKPTDPPKEVAQPDPAAPPATPAADAPPADPAAPPKPVAPTTWRPEAAAEWDKLPPTVQAEIAKREEDMFRGLEAYKGDATVGKTFNSAVAPFSGLLAQQQWEPMQLTHELMSAHAMLSMGTPDQKLAQVLAIADKYGIQLQPTDPADAPYEDPSVTALRKELNAVNSKIAQTEQYQREQETQRAAEIRAQLNSEIAAFSSDPKNIHFETVANDIAMLLSTKVAKDLPDAYEQAVYRNPVTRAAEIERVATEKAKAVQAAAAAKAETARRAISSNVRTSAKPASGTAGLGSIDDTLAETLANIQSREK